MSRKYLVIWENYHSRNNLDLSNKFDIQHLVGYCRGGTKHYNDKGNSSIHFCINTNNRTLPFI